MSTTFYRGAPSTLTSIDSGAALNSLANGSTMSSDATDNNDGSADYKYGILEIYLASIGSARTGAIIVRILKSADGTNYETTGEHLATWLPSQDTAAARKVIEGFVLPNALFKIQLVNNTGQTTAASANTLKLAMYNDAAT